MKIGIIGPSKMQYLLDTNEKAHKILSELAKYLAQSKHVIVGTPDKGSASEFFMKQYIANNGGEVFEVIPLNDREFGIDHVNLELGKHIDCKTWRNQPETLNEQTEALLCVGYSVGVLAEIAYSKWFMPKPVIIIKELITTELPKELKNLEIHYISYKDIEKILQQEKEEQEG